MLKTLDGADFATGRARFLDEDANALEGTAKIFVKIEPSNLGFPVLAQLDTGCPWSILKPEIAEAIQLMDEEGQPKSPKYPIRNYRWPVKENHHHYNCG